MEFKEPIEERLKKLKTLGFDRRAVEKLIKYRENSLDVLISKGGSQKLFVVLDLLLQVKILQKEISELHAQLNEVKSPENLRPMDGVEGDRATITALVEAVLELQEHVFKNGNTPKVKLLENASAILDKRHGKIDLEGLERAAL